MSRTRCRCIISPCLIVVWLCLFHPVAYAVNYGENLLVNGNAELCQVNDSTCPGTGGAVAGIPGWPFTEGAPTIVKYGSPGFPSTTDSGPSDRLKAFFAGGSTASSSLSQNIDVSANAADIDVGKVVCDVSAWLGGYLNDGDSAQFNVTFLNGAGAQTLSLGPVTTADRAGNTGLLNRSRTVSVPTGVRTISVALYMNRDPNNGGSYNDGYADSLSVVLRGPIVVTTTADSGAGSLRDAIPRATVITFDPTVFAASGAPHVISLAQDLPQLTIDLTITGPGAGILTVQPAPSGAGVSFYALGSEPKIKIEALTMGGVFSSASADLTLDHVVIRDMPSGQAGVQAAFSTVHISNSLITNNKVDHALIFDATHAFLQNCTISGNTSGNGTGVAIYNSDDSTMSATGCTISGNSGTPNNSSIVYATQSSLSLANCTISDNSVTSGDTILAGGPSGTTIGLFNDTIAGNFASNSVHSDSSSKITFNNTIFADSGPTFSSTNGGSFSSSPGYNLSTHNDNTVLSQTTDLNGRDPMLGPLQDNGGPTFTRALLPGSLAIDKGNSILAIDQRGLPRPVDDPNSTNVGNGTNPTDIGAFEFQLPTPTPTPTPTTPTPTPTPTPGILNNISSRLQVGTGGNVLFAGFTIQGTGSKKVFILAAGPSLTSVGVAGALVNPQLELHDSSGNTIATNDNWQTTQIGGVITADQSADIQSSGFAPADPAESAIIATLPPGAYTAIVEGVGGGTGVGIVELYDLSQNNGTNLTNISTRGFVQLGDNVLIGGFTVANQPVNVIVEAAGPSLRAHDVGNAMDDPQLELHDANGAIAANDDWQTTQIGGVITADQAGAIQQSGLAPVNPAEPALIARLSPGGYTAIMRGANNTSGVGVIAIYTLP
jgi:Right handed beta helix region